MPHDVPDTHLPARDSRTVLLLFSGLFKRPDGISAFLHQAGLEVEMVDNHPQHGGSDARPDNTPQSSLPPLAPHSR
eukprot:3195037-Pleurochrysis_carterae.AAC.1